MNTAEEKLEEVKALGFASVEQADQHAQWLREHGTPEFKAWLKQMKEAL